MQLNNTIFTCLLFGYFRLTEDVISIKDVKAVIFIAPIASAPRSFL